MFGHGVHSIQCIGPMSYVICILRRENLSLDVGSSAIQAKPKVQPEERRATLLKFLSFGFCLNESPCLSGVAASHIRICHRVCRHRGLMLYTSMI